MSPSISLESFNADFDKKDNNNIKFNDNKKIKNKLNDIINNYRKRYKDKFYIDDTTQSSTTEIDNNDDSNSKKTQLNEKLQEEIKYAKTKYNIIVLDPISPDPKNLFCSCPRIDIDIIKNALLSGDFYHYHLYY